MVEYAFTLQSVIIVGLHKIVGSWCLQRVKVDLHNFYGVINKVLDFQYTKRRRVYGSTQTLKNQQSTHGFRVYINTAHHWFVQVVQNKHVWDMPKVKEHENDHVELLEVVNDISCTIDELVEDINFYRGDVDHMVVEEQIIWQVDDDFINDGEEDV